MEGAVAIATALASPSAIATAAGERVVGLGGAPADAAIVMSMVAMCTEPGVCAPGAGGFVTIDPAQGDPVVVDGYMAVPGIGFEGDPVMNRVTMEYGGGVTTFVGPGSIAVPGSFAALSMVSRRFGRVPWAELMGITAEVVGSGFPLSQACRTYLVDSGEPIFGVDPASRNALFDGDRLKEAGERVVFSDLADTLRQIGEEGAETFYQGELGARIVSDLSGRGSCLTASDLAAYRPVARKPLSARLGGWRVSSNPPPAVGGVAILDAAASVARSDSPTSHVVWRDALVAALEHRRAFEESADSDAVIGLLEAAGLRSPSTISVAAVDGDGNAVTATFSSGYGSGVIPTGTGLLMNNSVGEVELVPGGVEALVPGERMMSNMAPTTARRRSDVVAIGSPGADRITSALAITLIRFLLAGDGLEAAIEHPRLHPEGLAPTALAAEPGIELPESGVRWYQERHMFFGGVNGVARIGDELVAHADTRRVGSAIVARH